MQRMCCNACMLAECALRFMHVKLRCMYCNACTERELVGRHHCTTVLQLAVTRFRDIQFAECDEWMWDDLGCETDIQNYVLATEACSS
eukprot:m.42375 g.42375  ORF g.42375 m.42375 type:complete len:88 (-) comp15025_c0_seq1:150-413(-)